MFGRLPSFFQYLHHLLRLCNRNCVTAAAGIVKTAQGQFPKIQIATIDDLLDGKVPNLPEKYVVTQDERKLMGQRKKQAESPQMEFTFAVPGSKRPVTKTGDVFYPAESDVADLIAG